jgi:hypothetical protein
MCFSKWWLLKIKAERCSAGRFFIDIMKRSQVGVMQSLINCMKEKGVTSIVNPTLIHWFAQCHIPVIRLLGSNTSILSNRSMAPSDMLRKRERKSCLGYGGSCLMYLRALSLRRNPRLASSGDPISFWMKKRSLLNIDTYRQNFFLENTGEMCFISLRR